jgi:hypothetical protein
VPDIVHSTAEGLARRVDRRRFLRRGANRLFLGFAVVTAGGGWSLLRAATAAAIIENCEPTTGVGCPTGCGPSTEQCCSYSQRSSLCKCAQGTGCLTQQQLANCRGYFNSWSGTSCWTCFGSWYTCGACSCRSYTSCCDCATVNCDDHGYCIGWETGTQKACPRKATVLIREAAS